MAYCPIAFVTGQTGKNVKALLNHAQMLFKQAQERVGTSMLNKLVKAALERHEPPLHQLKRPKIYYATQVSTQPPTIVLVCNNPQGFSGPYRRYLLGFLRDHLPFGEIPIKLYLQPRKRDDERDEIQYQSQPASVQPVVQDDESLMFDDEDSDDIDGDDIDGDVEVSMEVYDESDGIDESMDR